MGGAASLGTDSDDSIHSDEFRPSRQNSDERQEDKSGDSEKKGSWKRRLSFPSLSSGGSNKSSLTSAPMNKSTQIMFHDFVKRRVDSFAKQALYGCTDIEQILVFLTNPNSLSLFKRFLRKRLAGPAGIAHIEDINSITFSHSFSLHEYVSSMDPTLVMAVFKKFLDSSHFSQWLAENRASISHISCERIANDVANEKDFVVSLATIQSAEREVVDISQSVQVPKVLFGSKKGFGDEKDGEVVHFRDLNDFCDEDGEPITARRAKSFRMPKKFEVFNSAESKKEPVAIDTYRNISDGQYSIAALSMLNEIDFNRIVRSESWLSTLISAAESLPVSITLATASKTRLGFPLIYVNPEFERLTGYSRTDVIGRGCNFLQYCYDSDGNPIEVSNVNSERKIQQLRQVLGTGCPSTVELVNFRKNGYPFRNYVLLKPIFDQHRRYRYVIGLQFEIKSDDTDVVNEQKSNNRNLFNLIPDQVVVDDDDVDEEIYLGEGI